MALPTVIADGVCIKTQDTNQFVLKVLHGPQMSRATAAYALTIKEAQELAYRIALMLNTQPTDPPCKPTTRPLTSSASAALAS